MNITEWIFAIRSCIEILVNHIKINTATYSTVTKAL